MNSPRTPQPWERALSAQNEIYTFAEGEKGIEYMKGWLLDRLSKYGMGAMNPSEVALRLCDLDLLDCEPLYVTEDMQHLVYSAMETFDCTESVQEDDFFLKSGFAYLAEPFCSKDAQGKKLCWRAIQWFYDEMWVSSNQDLLDIGSETQDRLDNLVLNKAGRSRKIIFKSENLTDEDRRILDSIKSEPVVRIVLWSHVDDPDDYPYPPELIARLKSEGQFWGVAHATAIPIRDISTMDKIIEEGDTVAAWMTFLRVMNRLMAEKIVVRSPQEAPRALRRESQRLGNPRVGVIVVELRRRSQSGEHVEGKHREFSHRFIRHGHWRKQWYPSLKTHRQKYIANMVVGPADKPLIIKERVWLWDR